MAGVAAKYGEVGAAPYLIPLSVDGLVVVASICLVELSGRIQVVARQPDIKPDIRPDTKRTPRRDTGGAIARLRARQPDMSNQEIADRLGITDRTVRRHLSAAA